VSAVQSRPCPPDFQIVPPHSTFDVTEMRRRLRRLPTLILDNGPQYTATASVFYAHELGLVPIMTPAYSPESNGLAEGVVHTFKRDHVNVHELRDAETVLALLSGWIDDYNRQAPHSALGMRSQAEYRASLALTPPSEQITISSLQQGCDLTPDRELWLEPRGNRRAGLRGATAGVSSGGRAPSKASPASGQ
jgi:integrase-like protein